jgi:hypothetical protein
LQGVQAEAPVVGEEAQEEVVEISIFDVLDLKFAKNYVLK